ncbi:MAG: arylsulfatase [Burkholderiales bacterium]
MAAQPRPNIVLILVDDMGFSDIGCYGGEIDTPNIDRLAAQGVRFSQFYNAGRCSPSRASLLTGLHPHQTGIGVLTKNDLAHGGYPGSLNRDCVTIAEVLQDAGYATCLAGKWHLVSDIRSPNDAWPTRRGFDEFYGTLQGSSSYFQPGSLTRGEVNVESEAVGDYYYTDAITDFACDFVRRAGDGDRPFFLYAAYTAPHWPLHAREEDVAKYRGRFDEGWDVLRERRIERLYRSGILDETAALSARDPTQPAWRDAEHPAWELRRMEVYAAQVERMDHGVGRIVSAVEASGQGANTLVMFLSDNGACAEPLPLDGDADAFVRHRPYLRRLRPRNGKELQVGNYPSIMPGGDDTFASYGRSWANLSNTPFRFYKRWTHEGGVATPLIVRWPAGGLADGSIVRDPLQLTSVLPTLLEAAGATHPGHHAGCPVLPPEGVSFLPALRGQAQAAPTLYWEHTGNAAVRDGRWKLVREFPQPWELYDMAVDRSETRDLAATHPDVVARLERSWTEWAARVGVIPWNAILAGYRAAGMPENDAAG